MADFDTLESSVEDSRPIEVFDFSLGSESFLYTSSEDEVTVGTQTYSPEAIRRGAIAQGDEERDQVLEITVPALNTFARKYINVVPGLRASVSIIRVQRDEPAPFTQALIYKGLVQAVNFDKNGHEAKIGVRTVEASSSRPIPRFTYQGLCNHFLYDAGCGVNPDLFKFTGEVTAIDGNTITVSGASGEADDYYNAGYIKPAGLQDFRMVLNHTGDVLTLLLPFSESIIGTNVDIFAGCNHAVSGHCNTRFSNVALFGGWPWVPVVNPFRSGIT